VKQTQNNSTQGVPPTRLSSSTYVVELQLFISSNFSIHASEFAPFAFAVGSGPYLSIDFAISQDILYHEPGAVSYCEWNLGCAPDTTAIPT